MYARKRDNRKSVALIVITTGLLLLVSACALLNAPPKPVVTIAGGSPYGPAPLAVTFDISGSSDPDGQIVSFTFDFGDGTAPVQGTDLTQPIEHIYESAGHYLARLTVVDNTGKKENTQTPIIVSTPAR